MREFHTIVEFSYNDKKSLFIIRFLDGTCLNVPTQHLPKKYQKKIEWEKAELSKNKNSLIIHIKNKRTEIPAYILYSSGRII
jgi:hypothetical protein